MHSVFAYLYSKLITMTDLEIILFAIGCTITGATLAWIIRKLLFEKHSVPVKQLTEVNEKYQEVLTQKPVLQEKHNSLAEEKESYKMKLTQIESQYSELIQDHAKKSALNVSLIDDKDTLSKELSLED